jgi:hypothetical protein
MKPQNLQFLVNVLSLAKQSQIAIQFGLLILNDFKGRFIDNQIIFSQVVSQEISFFDLFFSILWHLQLEVFLMVEPPLMNESCIFFGCNKPSFVSWQPIGNAAL